MMIRKLNIPLILILLLVACNGNDEGIDLAEEPTAVSTPTVQDSSSDEDASTEETAVSLTVQPTLTPPPPPAPEAEDEGEPADDGLAVDTVEEPDAVQPRSETVMIEASDGLQIEATYAHPGGIAPFPGVILLHMLGSNRSAWDDAGLTAQLLQNGYAVLNVDMRGHGGTGGTIDWPLAEEDMQRVWDYFVLQEAVNGEKTAVVGASIGSNLSLITAVNKPNI
ncbi:MAG: alpha/beta fold hydrolase, partial [Chloroflexi bacterium]|nr:alpha/beta fold hydrolase [Chloroflexota bacterium]